MLVAPLASWVARMLRPPGPMTPPILSTGTCIESRGEKARQHDAPQRRDMTRIGPPALKFPQDER